MCKKIDIFIQNVIFSSSLRSKIKDWKVNFEDLTLIFEEEFEDSLDVQRGQTADPAYLHGTFEFTNMPSLYDKFVGTQNVLH